MNARITLAALAVAAAEMIEFGRFYMAQIVRNSKALGKALDPARVIKTATY